MTCLHRLCCFRSNAHLGSVALACAAACGIAAQPVAAEAPAGTVEPIYRVAYQDEAAAAPQQAVQEPAQVAARIVETPPQPAFDLTQRPGEHPLMPALRVAKDGVDHIDANIKDYKALLYKQERINGELQEMEVAYVKVRHQPFSVHMFFLKPHTGRECLYAEGPAGTEGKLHARDSGFRRKFGVFPLDPEGTLAMKGQKYPITKLGIRNLTTELIMVASNDVNFGECEVTVSQTELGAKDRPKRPVTLIDVVHPTPRQNFRFHRAQVFIDNELRIPIRYAAYLWPEKPGEQPPLEESYTYLDLTLNNGFTDADFSRDNPELFKD